jgi:hypothetical protein
MLFLRFIFFAILFSGMAIFLISQSRVDGLRKGGAARSGIELRVRSGPKLLDSSAG